MDNTGITRRNTVNQLLEKRSENRHYLELLRFFGAHPNTRFNRLAVIQSLNENDSEYDIERALVQLINKGVIKASNENNTRFYSLTEDESGRKWVMELVKLEWHNCQLAFRKAALQWNEAVNGKAVSITLV
jgi:predicted transcriptional regulator